jgi:hypothetical protein
MSKWLRSVNNLLEKLDDGTAAAAEVAGGTATAARRFLASSSSARQVASDDDDDYEEEADVDDGDYATDEDDDNEDDGYLSQGLTSGQEEEYESSNRGWEGNAMQASSEEEEQDEVNFGSDSKATSSQLFAVDNAYQEPPPPSPSLPALQSLGAPTHLHEATMRLIQEEKTEEQDRRGLLASPDGVASPADPAKSYSDPPLRDSLSSKPVTIPEPPSSKPRAVPSPASAAPPHPPQVVTSPPPSSTGALFASAASTAVTTSKSSLKLLQDQKKALAAEVSHLQAINATLQERLDRAEAEVRAQHDELMAAAASLQEERKLLREEKDEYLADHEDEIELKEQQHQEEIKKLHTRYQIQIKGLQDDLREQRAMYQRQGGDLSSEISKAVEEKERAVEEANDVKAEQEALKAQYDVMARQHESLQRQCAALEQSAEVARQAERRAEEKLDALLEQHKHQMSLRQAREAELERTVAELGSALTAAQAVAAPPNSHPGDGGPSRESLLASLREYQEKHSVAAEELESARAELRLTTRQCEALQCDIREMSSERDAEVAQSQQRQRQHDEQVSQLMAQIQRLQGSSSINGFGPNAAANMGDRLSDDDPRLRQTEIELGESKRQMAELSDQLLRLQGIVEASKSEVLVLKGRLQAANSRADAAEAALASASTSAYDVEGGGGGGGGSGSKSRRRVKGGFRALGGGGLSRPSHLAPRSVRAALGLRVVSGSTMEQVALTVDALDNWMMDTGSILKAEPLARVAFAVYLTILHCWCFALVFFHAVESEHGDLGALTHRGGPLHPGKK